jgi:hypothetical protein
MNSTPDLNTHFLKSLELPRAVPGEYLVKFRNGVSKGARYAHFSKAGVRETHEFSSVPGLYVTTIDIDIDVDISHAKQLLESSADVEYVEPNFIVRSFATQPNDPDFLRRQWSLLNVGQLNVDNPILGGPDINVTRAWDITTGNDSLVVAIIDSGIDYTHPDLAANMYRNAAECAPDNLDNDNNGYVDDCYGIDTANSDTDPKDDEVHGTHVAGIVGAVSNNGIGIAGVAWQVKLLPCKFLRANGEGTTANAIACLDYVATLKQRGVNIVATNNSWGGYAPSRALTEAITAQRNLDILFVTVADNEDSDNDEMPVHPCSADVANIVCVTSAYDARMRFAGYGRRTVHLGAPGEPIYSTVPNGGYDSLSGTSMAAPHVTGAAVLLKAQSPQRDWRAIKNLLLVGTVLPTQFSIETITAGRLDVYRAMTCTDRTLVAPLRPLAIEPLLRPVGAQIELRALSVRCANSFGPVSFLVSPTNQSIQLRDDGTNGDEAAGDGVFVGSWTTPGVGEFTLTLQGSNAPSVRVVVDADLKTGFIPRKIISASPFGGTHGGPDLTVIGNVDLDLEPEILTSGSFGTYAWNNDGSTVLGWSGYSVGAASPLTLGEFDGNQASSEVALVAPVVGLTVRRGDTTPLPGWPQIHRSGLVAPAVDFDRDGVDELASYPARRANGSLFGVAGFPAGATPYVPNEPPQGPFLYGPPAIVDLDGDGVEEVVSSDNVQLTAWSTTGRMPGFPVSNPFSGGQRFIVGVTAGDIDGDGRPELVIPSMRVLASNEWRLDVYSSRGQLVRTLSTDLEMPFAPSMADLDADGVPEIVVALPSSIQVWRGNGQPLPGWPVVVGNNLVGTGQGPVAGGTVAIGDITGDGQPDVVVAGRTTPFYDAKLKVLAFHRNGTPIAGFPKTWPMDVVSTTPMIADLDHDGRNELIMSSAVNWGNRDAVFAYDLRGPAPYGPIEWGQYGGGPARRSSYQLGQSLLADVFISAQVHGSGRIAASVGTLNCSASCTEKVPRGTTRTITATPNPDATFSRWLGACANQSNPCSVTVNAFATVAAEFNSNLSVRMTGNGTGTVISEPDGIDCPGNCSLSASARRTIVLRATANVGSGFIGWSGECSGSAPTCEVVVSQPRAVEAQFSTEFPVQVGFTGGGGGVVTSSPSGVRCSGPCTGLVTVGATVTMTATANADSQFLGWLGDCVGGDACTFVMDRARSVTARMVLRPVATVSIAGTGGGRVTSTPPGISCPGDCTEIIPSVGPGLTLAAVPDANSVFAGWSGPCAANGDRCNVSPSADQTIVATFNVRATVRVNTAVTGNGRVTSSPSVIDCSGNCANDVLQGTVLTVTATPGNDSYFVGWSGACSGTNVNCQLTPDSAANVSATFALKPLVQLTFGGGGTGTIQSSPTGLDCTSTCGARFAPNTNLTLTATPTSGYAFAGWSGACSGTGNTCTLSVNADTNIGVSFTAATPPNPSGNVASGGGGAISLAELLALALLLNAMSHSRTSAAATRRIAYFKLARR